MRRQSVYDRWDPERYVAHSLHQEKLAGEIISRISLKEGARVLDIGCGDGKAAARIAVDFPSVRVTGVDHSAEMVAYAGSAHRLPNLEFKVMDAQHLSFQEQFDFILSISCLHWISDHVTLLRGIRDALKPGGRTFLQFMGDDENAPIMRGMKSFFRDGRLKQHDASIAFPFHFFSAEKYRSFVEAAGLKILRVELVQKEIAYESRHGLAAMYESVLIPATKALPDAVRMEIIFDMVDGIIGDCRHEDGKICTNLPRLEVEVEKI